METRKIYTFNHKDGNAKAGYARMFSACSVAEAQHYAACHYDGLKMPCISEWTEAEFKQYVIGPDFKEVFSDVTRVICWDARFAAKGSKVGYRNAYRWWVAAAKGQCKHAGYGSFKEPSQI